MYFCAFKQLLLAPAGIVTCKLYINLHLVKDDLYPKCTRQFCGMLYLLLNKIAAYKHKKNRDVTNDTTGNTICNAAHNKKFKPCRLQYKKSPRFRRLFVNRHKPNQRFTITFSVAIILLFLSFTCSRYMPAARLLTLTR